MIDHIFIKNYKAFERENIPLDKFSLLIGSFNSGKTTVLEALNLFFNTQISYESIRNKDQDVIIEIHINEERYRKTFSPPTFDINYEKCIGNMYEINDIKYLYIPKEINNKKLLNDILSINYSHKIQTPELSKIFKMFDYIDGTLGNSNYPIFSVQTKIEMDIKEQVQFTKKQYTKMLSNITHQRVIIGIDNVEDHFDLTSIQEMTKYNYQTIFVTNDEHIASHFDYSVVSLYKEDIKKEFDTVRKQVSKSKKYILVEGKYDVAWFEKALHLLDLYDQYRVIPCGGFGNIVYVQEQLKKEGFVTLTVTDGDVNSSHSLQRDVIELYADPSYINKRFKTNFKELPSQKHLFFKAFHVKDDVVKKVLSSWAKKHLDIHNPFVQELKTILMEHRR